MKRPLRIFVFLLTLPCTVGAQDELSVVSKLKELCANPDQLAEALVRPASLLVQQQYLNRPWDDVRAELSGQGLRVPEGRDSQYLMLYDVPVASDALRVGDISFDLILAFKVDKRSKEDAPTAQPNHVLTATATLRGSVGLPTAEIIASNVFPLDSVLGRAMSSPVRQEEDGGYEVLKEIEMSYDLIRHHRESEWPYGYHLRLFFGQPSDEEWQKRIFLTVLSSEDPPRDSDYNVVRNWRGWQWTGLDAIQCWGSTER